MRAADFGQIDLSAPILVERLDRRSGERGYLLPRVLFNLTVLALVMIPCGDAVMRRQATGGPGVAHVVGLPQFRVLAK